MSDESVGAGPGPAILAETPWAELPEATLERLLPGARVRHVPARGAIFRLGDPEPRAGILLAGTARAFLAAADGRQLTVRYVRRGALLARRSTLLGGHTPVAIHALTAVTLLDLHAPRFLRLVETEPQVARVVLAELSRRLEDVHATDRQRFSRVFHQLLDRGVHLPPSPYEAMFLSTAHGDAEIAATLEAFDAAFATEAAAA